MEDNSYDNFYSIDNLTEIEEKELFEKYRYESCVASRDKIFISHMKMVLSAAKQYRRRNEKSLYDDIVQEGAVGLLNAIDRFDPIGARFNSFALPYIKMSMRNFLRKRFLLYVPERKCHEAFRLKRYMDNYDKRHHRRPSMSDMREHMNKTRDSINDLIDVIKIINEVNISEKRIKFSKENPSDGIVQADLLSKISEEINLRPSLEKDIVEMRYGLKDGQEKSWRKIASLINISHQTVKNTHDKAMRSIRKSFI